MINRENPLPLYVQLKEFIIEKVNSDKWKRGEMIPAELDLQKRFNLSRTTVRQAITELVYEGVLERIQGKGTFVAEEKLEPIRPGLTGFTEDMERHGYKVNSIIKEKSFTKPSQEVQRNLNLKSTDKVWKLERIRLVDDIPIGYHETFLNLSATPNVNIEKYDFTSDSLYSSLKNEGIQWGDSDETLEAKIPSEKYANIFKIDTSVPVLKVERLVRLHDGTPYEYSNMVYRSDRYKYNIKLRV